MVSFIVTICWFIYFFQIIFYDDDDFPSLLHADESADWEKELQQELQEYEVVTESDHKDDQWDQEIEKMLQGDES